MTVGPISNNHTFLLCDSTSLEFNGLWSLISITSSGTSLVVQWLRTHLVIMQKMQVSSLVGELGSYMPRGNLARAWQLLSLIALEAAHHIQEPALHNNRSYITQGRSRVSQWRPDAAKYINILKISYKGKGSSLVVQWLGPSTFIGWPQHKSLVRELRFCKLSHQKRKNYKGT